MKITKPSHRRVAVVTILLCVQLFLVALFVLGILARYPMLGFLSRIISGLVVLYLVNKDDEAAYKVIWLIVILALPRLGGVLYLVFGDKKPSKQLQKAFKEQLEHVSNCELPSSALTKAPENSVMGQLDYLVYEGFSMYPNQEATYYPLGDDNFPALLNALKEAKHFIFMEYFIVEKGDVLSQVMDVLKQKVKEGVEVRFLYDDMGSLTLLPRNFPKELQRWGIQCTAFNRFSPLLSASMNHRDHRKITVIDGWIGFTGGMNLADEYINQRVKYGHWKDTGIKIIGESVWNLTTMFLSTWNATKKTSEDFDKYHPKQWIPNLAYKEDSYIVPYGDSPLDNAPVGQNVYLNMIHQAKQYIYISTPYLILNESLQTALILARQRGVDVRICTPGIPDKKLVFRVTRSYYEPLVNHGIRIYEYSPGFLHGKNFVCDDIVATVGTINLDYRSLFLHFECGVFMYKSRIIQDIKEDFLKTIAVGEEMTKEKVQKGRFRGWFEAILRIFAPLL